MELTYNDMYMLLQREPAAREYYKTLPRQVQELLDFHSDGVTTLPRLVERAQQVARGGV